MFYLINQDGADGNRQLVSYHLLGQLGQIWVNPA